MEKLTYTTEEQIINDAAQMLIKSHLKWSNSLNFMPSSRLSNVYSMMMDAILESKYTPEEWRALTESESMPTGISKSPAYIKLDRKHGAIKMKS